MDLMQMLMGAMTQTPPGPGGNMVDSPPAGAVPPAILNGDPTAELNELLQQILAMYMQTQVPQQAMGGMGGFEGGMYGAMGGRPPGGSELQNPDLAMMF